MTDKYAESKERYRKSERGKAANKRYEQSERGRAAKAVRSKNPNQVAKFIDHVLRDLGPGDY